MDKILARLDRLNGSVGAFVGFGEQIKEPNPFLYRGSCNGVRMGPGQVVAVEDVITSGGFFRNENGGWVAVCGGCGEIRRVTFIENGNG